MEAVDEAPKIPEKGLLNGVTVAYVASLYTNQLLMELVVKKLNVLYISCGDTNYLSRPL